MLGVLAFALATVLQWMEMDTSRILATAVGVAAGCCVSVNAREICLRASRHRRVAAIAVTAGLCSVVYFSVTRSVWREICAITAWCCYELLTLLGIDARFDMLAWPSLDVYLVLLRTPHFSILLAPMCSGLEGVFIFYALLSAALLLDWPLFRRQGTVGLYVLGSIYMLTVNVLRITAYCLLGSWAWGPDAGPYAESLRGVPLEMFHGHVGWLIYLLAFWLFLTVLYKWRALAPQQPG